LRLGLAVAPASGLIDSAAVEAAIMAGQLIQFLGLGIEFREEAELLSHRPSPSVAILLNAVPWSNLPATLRPPGGPMARAS
jgi:hypothetical protein